MSECQDNWVKFSEISINDDDEIQEQFLHFEPGTDRFYVWLWFEKTYNVRVIDLLRGKRKEQE